MEHLEVKQEPGTWDGEVSNEYQIHKNLRLIPFNFMVMLLYLIFSLDVDFFLDSFGLGLLIQSLPLKLCTVFHLYLKYEISIIDNFEGENPFCDH